MFKNSINLPRRNAIRGPKSCPCLGNGEGMAEVQQAIHVGVGEVAEELFIRLSLPCRMSGSNPESCHCPCGSFCTFHSPHQWQAPRPQRSWSRPTSFATVAGWPTAGLSEQNFAQPARDGLIYTVSKHTRLRNAPPLRLPSDQDSTW